MTGCRKYKNKVQRAASSGLIISDVLQVYWFKDGKQISKRSEHYRISREADGTCSLHTAAASLDDDGNYTIMAGNPKVSGQIKHTRFDNMTVAPATGDVSAH